MGKISLLLCCIFTGLFSENIYIDNEYLLQKKCLTCHQKQQIPNDLIYRRYLMVYSTSRRMGKAIFLYMKNPDKNNSVMHHPFFFKFPMKEKLALKDATLKKMISEYLIKFDVKKKFKNIE